MTNAEEKRHWLRRRCRNMTRPTVLSTKASTMPPMTLPEPSLIVHGTTMPETITKCVPRIAAVNKMLRTHQAQADTQHKSR